ncbi:lysylphosphatidylglycerol synthase transmembrane domain-containing protein [Microvirga sp. M2]|uniref:lysylphosphatidylglycerol synthase transmembrane domain-containing protein n=1 Tax=Microvirga sp. M2 TaxID=3073270 RepID=UPI0039C3D2EC
MNSMKEVRRFWPYMLAAICCTWALITFDWTSIGQILWRFDYVQFLLAGVPLTLAVLGLRSLRWIAVAGMPFRWSSFRKVFVYTALAIAAATPSPMQLGELLKLKFTRDETGSSYAHLSVAFALERAMDLAVLAFLAAVGFSLHGTNSAVLALTAALLFLSIALLLPTVRFLTKLNLPGFLSRTLKPIAQYQLSPKRLACLGLSTIAKWLLVALLWNAVFMSLDIEIPLSTVLIVVVGVTLSVSLSLIPGGIGIAEVSTRALLVWFGTDITQAEAGAIGLRVISPLMIGLGLLIGLRILMTTKHSPGREADEKRYG